MQALKSTWKIILSLKALLLAVFLVLSLSINAAMFISESLFTIVSSAFEVVTGTKTVASRYTNRINELDDALVVERKAKKELKKQLADASSGVVTLRGKKMAMRDAVETTADSISKRAVKSSAREVGSMAGEALPYIGTAVIVGVTALELKDLCATVIEMNDLKRAFDAGEVLNDDQTTVCSMPVPSKEQLWEDAKASPMKAWLAAKEAAPNLEDIKFPEVDMTRFWHSISSMYKTVRIILVSEEEPKEG